MSSRAARPLPTPTRRDTTKPAIVPPPVEDDSGVVQRPGARIRRHETTAPFATAPTAVSTAPRTSEIRELAPRTSYKPPAPPSVPTPRASAPSTPTSPSTPSVPPPRASLADIPKKTSPRAERERTMTEGFVEAPRGEGAPRAAVAPPRRDPTPILATRTPTPPPPISVAPATPPAPPTSVAPSAPPTPPPAPSRATSDFLGLETTELPLEEIDYDAAYAHDAAALEARLRRRTSILPPAIAEMASEVANDVKKVAGDVRESLTPTGRAEAARELRSMRRVTLRGLATLLRHAAQLVERYA